ncbi:MAG: DNA repair protein RadA [Bacillota bacterium]|nr:DNA repair protein RadA [Bacillota bacterium]
MAKKSTIQYVCQSCGSAYTKWQGRCNDCGEWNSLIEEVTQKSTAASRAISIVSQPVLLRDVKAGDEERIRTGISELDIVLGGGLVRGSLVLVGGDPGIGKSTLLLQAADHLAKGGHKLLYVSGEESVKQTKLRAERLSVDSDQLYIVSEGNLDAIRAHVEALRPEILIVDSIQTVSSADVASAPGSVTQVREATAQFMEIAKSKGISTFLVGHVTKSGTIAGPKILEHMVDTVLYFEGDGQKLFRVLRAVKNRFGSTNEIGVFEMTNRGLIDVDNPSKLFLAGGSKNEAGSVILPALEGSRTVLVELQCLVSASNFNNPRRMAMGIDFNKLVLLIAVLEKRGGLMLYQHDVYLNVVGGVELEEPSLDLAVVMAIASSYKNFVVPSEMVILGEVGLTGEIRAVSHVQQRINEAARMGFTKAIVPHGNLEGLQKPDGFSVVGLRHIGELLRFFT